MSYYILDEAGFVTGTYDGPGQPASSTDIRPPDNAVQPLQFVGGAWLVAAEPVHHITYMAFLSRFTSGERATVRAVLPKDTTAADVIMLAQAALFIDLEDPRVVGGVHYFASVGIITAVRIPEILSLEISDSERP